MFAINKNRIILFGVLVLVITIGLSSCIPAIESASAEKGVHGFTLQYKAVGNILDDQSSCCSEELLGARLANGFIYIYVKFKVKSGFPKAGFIFNNPFYLIDLDDNSRLESNAVYPDVDNFFISEDGDYVFRLSFPEVAVQGKRYRLFEAPGCEGCLDIGPFVFQETGSV